MRFTYFALVLALLTHPAAAQNKKNAPAQSSTSILINGQAIKGKVLEMDGKHFVAVEDLAQSLRGTIAYGDGQIALTLSELPPATPQPLSSEAPPATAQPLSSQIPPTTAQPPSSQIPSKSAQPPSSKGPPATAQPLPSQIPPTTAQPIETGRIKGTLTYFFDFHSGNKPDAGSKVWLVKGRAEIPPNETFVGTSMALGTGGNPEQYTAIKYSIADENGNFEMRDIPVGQYTLIMQSAHTKGTLNEKWSLFGKGNSHRLRDSSGRVESLNLEIKAGETFNASKDFGPNIE
jgi:hypothetical protein